MFFLLKTRYFLLICVGGWVGLSFLVRDRQENANAYLKKLLLQLEHLENPGFLASGPLLGARGSIKQVRSN